MIAKRHAAGLLLTAGVLVGAAAPGHDAEPARWPFGVGSWVQYEIRESTGDSVVIDSLRSTVVRNDAGMLYLHEEPGPHDIVLHHPDAGGIPFTPGRDSVVGEQVLVVNGQRFRCRVVRSDLVDVPMCGNDPVDFTRSTVYRWQSPDFPRFGGVIRSVSNARATYYVDGRVESSRDSMIWEVLSLHEPRRIGRRSVDCWVERTITPDIGSGNPPDTVTTWLSADIPSQEVRSVLIEHASGRQTRERNAVAFEVRK